MKSPHIAHRKPTTRPWSEPPLELEPADLVSVPPPGDLGLDLTIDFDREGASAFVPAGGLFGSRESLRAHGSSIWVALQPLGSKLVEVGRARARWAASLALLGLGAIASWMIVPLVGSSASAPADPLTTRAALVVAGHPVVAPASLGEAADRSHDVVRLQDAIVPNPPSAPPSAPARARPISPTAQVASKPKTESSSDLPKRTSAPAPPPPAAATQPAALEPAAMPERTRPAGPPAPLPDVDVAADFDRSAAMDALRQAGDRARSCGGIAGTSVRVSVTFARTGRVSDARVDGAAAGTPAGECMVGRFRGVQIPPFRGSSMTVYKTVIF